MIYIAFFEIRPTLMYDWVPPEASGLGVSEETPVPALRPVCGVAGAEVATDDVGAG